MDQVNSVPRDILSALNIEQVNSVSRDILSALNMDQVNSVPRDILSAHIETFHVIYYLH